MDEEITYEEDVRLTYEELEFRLISVGAKYQELVKACFDLVAFSDNCKAIKKKIPIIAGIIKNKCCKV